MLLECKSVVEARQRIFNGFCRYTREILLWEPQIQGLQKATPNNIGLHTPHADSLHGGQLHTMAVQVERPWH
jgi:hypothetical protein